MNYKVSQRSRKRTLEEKKYSLPLKGRGFSKSYELTLEDPLFDNFSYEFYSEQKLPAVNITMYRGYVR